MNFHLAVSQVTDRKFQINFVITFIAETWYISVSTHLTACTGRTSICHETRKFINTVDTSMGCEGLNGSEFFNPLVYILTEDLLL